MLKNILKSSAAILFLTIIAILFFCFTKIEMPLLFLLIPIYFVIVSILLAVFAKRNNNEKRMFSNILIFRFAVVFFGLIILIVGIIFDKENLLSFAISFVLYYIVFSIIETQVMIKSTKKIS
jgi:hypothetical protein